MKAHRPCGCLSAVTSMVCQTGLLIWALVLMRYVTDQIYWNYRVQRATILQKLMIYLSAKWFLIFVLSTIAKLCKRIMEKAFVIRCLHFFVYTVDKFSFEYLPHDIAKCLFVIHVQ